MARPAVDIVIPVYNEQAVLQESVRRLDSFLRAGFPVSWRITIADNASIDDTLAIASRLAREFGSVRAVHLDERGRGRALRHTWLASDADVVAYMDVDLSTGLDAFGPLVHPLLAGRADIGIGSRLAPGARVTRGAKREVISRSYNLMLRTMMRARFSDAQCGFKAMRSEVAAMIVPLIEDDEWFFDTELLLLAQHNGMRIHEVPVEWIDDPDSRVDIVQTAANDLKGMWRMNRRFVRGEGLLRPLTTASRATRPGFADAS